MAKPARYVPRLFISLLALALLSGCSWFHPTLAANRVFSMPRPNRMIETTGVWADAKPLRTTLTQSRSGLTIPAELRAIHDGSSICFLVMWPDRTPSEERRMWVWDEDGRQYYLREFLTDSLAFKFHLSGAQEACMMTGEAGVYDIWQWRDGWSHVFGYAEDRRLVISNIPPVADEAGDEESPPQRSAEMPLAAAPQATLYPATQNGSPVYIRWIEDAGSKPYDLTPRPRRHERPTVLGVRATEPTGSQADVLAEGIHQNGMHIVEIMRALKTGHEDDYQFEGSGPHLFSIAITDNDENESHYTSELIYLRLD
jgi:hypothetical protein